VLEPSLPTRLPPLPVNEWPREMKEALAPVSPPTPRPEGTPKGLNVLGMFAHHPPLCRAFHVLMGHVLYATTLSARQREILIVRIGAIRGAYYEWAQHVVLGGEAGLTRAEIAALSGDADSVGWSPVDAALIRAVDDLIADARIGDDAWAVLAEGLTTQQILDVICTVGGYDMLAMAMRSTGIPLDDDLRAWIESYRSGA
jgi:alkylhydroperoxidase family enzyme